MVSLLPFAFDGKGIVQSRLRLRVFFIIITPIDPISIMVVSGRVVIREVAANLDSLIVLVVTAKTNQATDLRLSSGRREPPRH